MRPPAKGDTMAALDYIDMAPGADDSAKAVELLKRLVAHLGG